VLLRNNLFSLTSTFSSLLEAGIPPAEALELSRDSLTNVVLRERLNRVIADVREGIRLGQAFREQKIFPPLLSQGVITGEMSGAMAPTLRALADYYEQETTRAIGAATELIQPVVMLLVAGFVGFVAAAMISGIYTTIGSIK
jgi:type II secretory pathway component PulF